MSEDTRDQKPHAAPPLRLWQLCFLVTLRIGKGGERKGGKKRIEERKRPPDSCLRSPFFSINRLQRREKRKEEGEGGGDISLQVAVTLHRVHNRARRKKKKREEGGKKRRGKGNRFRVAHIVQHNCQPSADSAPVVIIAPAAKGGAGGKKKERKEKDKKEQRDVLLPDPLARLL